MKNCSLGMIIFVALAFNGNSTTASYDRSTKDKLRQYINEKKALAWWAPTSVPSLLQGFASVRGMGEVDAKEIKLLLSLEEDDIKNALEYIDKEEAAALAQAVYEIVKNIENSNRWHTVAYEEISKNSGKELFGNNKLSRSEVTERMYAQKEKSSVKKAFIKGLIVTKAVEEMMSTKR